MTVNIHPKGGGPPYSPERDWAIRYPEMVCCVASAFDKDYWPDLCDAIEAMYKESTGEDTGWWEEMMKANQAYCRFINSCAGQEDPTTTMHECLTESGWFEAHLSARIGWLAMLGEVMTGQLFSGLRDITELGAGPRPEIQDIMRIANDGRRALNSIGIDSDLKTGLGQLLRLLRNEGVSWETIDLITRREKNAEK